MNTNNFSTLHAYIFGTGPYAGIALLTGDAGVDIDTTLSFDDFRDVVKSYLDEEDGATPELLAELADTELMQELYAEWVDSLED